MKKMIYFSLMAFLFMMGCTKVANDPAAKPDENQLKAAPTNGSVSYQWTGGYYVDLICGDEVVDYLTGTVDWHIIEHYTKGKIEWSIYNPKGSLQSEKTGEVFEIHESDKVYVSDYTFHCNLIGNMGSHYIISGSGLLVRPWTVTIDKAVCPNGPQN